MKIHIYFFLVEKVNEQLIGPKQFFFSVGKLKKKMIVFILKYGNIIPDNIYIIST